MEDYTNEVKEEFIVDNDRKAEYCMKKIKAAQDEHDRLMELVKIEREELNKKAEEIEKHLESETGYLKSLLWKYFEKVDSKETKTQRSYKLLSGSLVYKKPQTKIVKGTDEAWDTALIGYLESTQPELIETVRKPAWGEFKKNLVIGDDGKVVDMSTGEVLDFIKAEEEPGKFDVKF